MKMIEIEKLRKSYDKQEVLHGMNLAVEKGSIHGLIGRNGCGKTTLIKCLAGIYQLNDGKILIAGEEVYENPKIKSQIGYVADSNQYFEGYHIDEMVDFYKDMYPTFSVKDFESYNESIGLDVTKRIKELSKGQSMALATILNLSYHPNVMIMDEPLSGLDAIVQRQVKEFVLSEVEHQEMTVLISSHDLKDLESFCDSITMMKEGIVTCSGSIDQVKTNVTKLQVVFQKQVATQLSQLPWVLTYSNIGSVYTIVLNHNSNVVNETLQEMGAILIEEIPITLEEMFVYNNQ